MSDKVSQNRFPIIIKALNTILKLYGSSSDRKGPLTPSECFWSSFGVVLEWFWSEKSIKIMNFSDFGYKNHFSWSVENRISLGSALHLIPGPLGWFKCIFTSFFMENQAFSMAFARIDPVSETYSPTLSNLISNLGQNFDFGSFV